MLSEYNTLVLTLLIVYALAILIQVFYYLFFYLRLALFHPVKDIPDTEPVSVIIAARDEARNLESFLPVVLEQDYPDYEVIVVNDCSEDNTGEVLEAFSVKYPGLHVTTIKKDDKFRHGKKLALTIGIKAAKHEFLLFADADCRPAGPYWIRDMQRNFGTGKEFVLGYGGYFPGKGFLNPVIRLDTVWIAMQYLGFALAGVPYMGVGRNLAYRKSVFFTNRGFAGHTRLDSGDDDLFVNALARKHNTGVELSHTAHTRSVPKSSFREWLVQKKRHLTTGSYYRFSSKFLLGLEWFTRVLTYAGFALLLFLSDLYIPLVAAFLFRWVLMLTVFKFAMSRLNEKNLLLYSLLYDLVQPLLNLIFFLSNKVQATNNKWG